jgi:hypothetical protein
VYLCEWRSAAAGCLAADALQATTSKKDGKIVRSYAVRHLSRWPLGMRYPQIVSDLLDLLLKPPQQTPPQHSPPLAGCVLAIDATGVGRPVVELFQDPRLPAVLRPVLITAGLRTGANAAGSVPPRSALHRPCQRLPSFLRRQRWWDCRAASGGFPCSV